MDDLDKKLRKILQEFDSEVNVGFAYPEAVNQIKQVFADAGWCALSVGYPAHGLMTGKMWYGRFMDELPDGNLEDFDDNTMIQVKQAIEAAKRASGVSDELIADN